MLVATRGARAAAWTAPRTLPSSSRGARASCPRASPGSRRPSARSLRPRRGGGFAPAAPPGRGVAVVARAGPGGAGGGDLYALLNVPSTATKKEIKAAYKKAALKFHPDVNKAPDAAERFNEVKQAYQTLSDEDSRRRYDALRGGGFGGFGGFGNTENKGRSRETSRERSPGGARRRSSSSSRGTREEDEPFYGFSDFWSDMEKEFEAFEKKRPDPGRPRTLWEELEALGEELVDFLEESAPETTRTSRDPFGTETRTTSSSSSGSARRKDGTASASYASSSSRTASSSASSATARSKAPPPKRESVDEMLEKLKRDMGMK